MVWLRKYEEMKGECRDERSLSTDQEREKRKVKRERERER
jgi:hypothetical protein